MRSIRTLSSKSQRSENHTRIRLNDCKVCFWFWEIYFLTQTNPKTARENRGTGFRVTYGIDRPTVLGKVLDRRH